MPSPPSSVTGGRGFSFRISRSPGNAPRSHSYYFVVFNIQQRVKSLDYANELAERLGADLQRPMRKLSRGNKQKIGLIQAMFHRPPLLILDKPIGGLDPLVQEEFLKIIGEVRDEGRTVFFSSHVLDEVEHICNRVGIIRDGELATVENTDS